MTDDLTNGIYYNNPNEVASIFSQQGFMFLFSPTIYKELIPCIWGSMMIGMMHCSRKILIACIGIILISILPMIAATDYFRLPFYAFPGLFILSAAGFEHLFQLKAQISYFWIFICAAAMYFFPQSILIGLILSCLMVANFFLLKRTET
jgi:hypothetical protein